ncbi:MAG: TraR/DksA family transcriptional regulator [Candidatus Omnitrophota bacterium]
MKKLTKKELKQYKDTLLVQREKISGEVGRLTKDYLRKNSMDSSGDISSHPFHMADAASGSFDTEFNIGLASSEQELLYQIDQALKRIEDGTFGNCEECGAPISKNRLKAVPFARYCIKHQESQERGNPSDSD